MSFKKRALTGGAIVLFGFGASQAIRLAGNLILTRILYPELFGVMALINAVIIGMKLFSDVGIRGGLINSNQSEDAETYNTAWTLQILRGLCIFVVVCLVALPLQNFYSIDDLALILVVTALSSLIDGFYSTSIISAEKKLVYNRTVSVEIASQFLAMIIMVALGWIYQSIWVLVFGTISQSLFYMLASHWFFNEHKNRLCWNKAAFSELFKYGKWIMLSTAAGYVTMQGDRLLIAKYFSTELLGIYSIAIVISMFFSRASGVAATKFLLPLYRNIFTNNESLAPKKISTIHYLSFIAGVIAYLPVAFWGDYIVGFLYDDRYVEAGWMLQILAVAGISGMLTISLWPMLLAKGDSFSLMKQQCIQCFLYIALLVFGVELFGLVGMFMALILTPLVSYPFLYYYVNKYGYKGLLLDVVIATLAFSIVIMFWVNADGVVLQNINDALKL